METHGPGPRPGYRDNGLRAERYVVLADLDPRVADALLAELAAAGIAAYVGPNPGVRGGYLETRLPPRPADRMWVDARAERGARALLDHELAQHSAPEDGSAGSAPEAVAPDEDAVWRELVESFSAPAAAVGPWPVSEDLDAPPAVPARVVHRVEPADDFVAAPIDLDAEEHFRPPAPPPLPRPQLPTVLAVVAMVAGVALLSAPALLGWQLDELLSAVAVACLLGGFGTLVYRMKDDPPSDSGPDDGAVV